MATVGVVKAIITADTTQLKKGMTDAQQSMDRMGKQMSKVGKSMTMKVTAPLVGVGVAAAKMASDFEFSMTQIETLVGRSTQEVNTLKGAVLGLSGQTGRAPKELADAMFFITSAGLDAASATAALEMSAKAAAVGLGDTVIVADAVTNAMNGYGMSADGAAFATDVLAKTVEQGKASAADLAPQFGRLIPMAAELGISFDQVGGGLAFLTRSSGDAALSATQLGGVMKSILKPSQQAQKTFDEIGVDLKGLRAAASEDLLGALQGLRDKLEANGLEMSNVFEDIRGLNGALMLTGKATGQAREVFDELADSSGKLDEAFRGVQKTAQFQMTQAMSAMKASMITLGEAILPVVIPMLQGLASVIEKAAGWFGSLSSGMRTTIVVLGVIVAAIGPVLMIAGALTSALTTLGIVAAGATVSLSAILLPLAAIVAVGAVVFSLFNKWGNEAEEAAGRQQLLTDGLRDMNDPATTMVSRIDELVEANVRLKAALDDSADSNKDGAESVEGYIGQATLQAEIIERDVVGAFEKLGLAHADVEAVVKTGTDAFDREYNVLNALSSSVYDQNRALEGEEQAVKDVAAAVRQSIADKDISLEQGVAILQSLDESADAYDDHTKKLEKDAKAYLSNAEHVQGFIDLLGAEKFASIKAAGAGKTHAEQLALYESAVLDAATAVQVQSHRQREAAATNEMVRTAAAALASEERRLNNVRAGSINMMVDSSEAADDYRDALNGSLPPLHEMIDRLSNGLGPALDQTAEKWDALVVSAQQADRAMLGITGMQFDIEGDTLTNTSHWVGVVANQRAEAAAAEIAAADELRQRQKDAAEILEQQAEARRKALGLANDMKAAQNDIASATRGVATAAEDVRMAEAGIETVLNHQLDLQDEIAAVADERKAVAAEIDTISDRITANLQKQRDLEQEGTEFAASIAQEFRKAALSVLELTDKVEELRNEAEAVAPDTATQQALIAGMRGQVAAVNEVEEALIEMGIISSEDAGMMDLTVKQAKTLVRLQRELEETTADYEAGETSLLDLMGATQDYNTAMNTATADSRALQQAQEDLNEMVAKGAEIDANREKTQLKLAIAEEELRLATQMGTEETFKQNRILEEQAKLEVDRLSLLDEKAAASERDHQLDMKSVDLKSELAGTEYSLQMAHDAVTAAKAAQAVADEELHYSEARLAEVMGRVNAAAKDGTGLFGDLKDIIHAVTGEFRSLVELMEKPIKSPSSTSGGGGGGGGAAGWAGAPTGVSHGWTPPTEWMMNVAQKGGADLWSQISGAATTDASNVAARFNALNEALQAGHTPGAVEKMLSMFDSAQLGGVVQTGGLVNVHAGETITPSGGGATYITVNIEGSVSSERELVESIRRGLLRSQQSGRAVVLN